MIQTQTAVNISPARQVQNATVLPVKVIAFKDWSMTSPQGNQAMKRKAESLIKNLEKVKASNGSLSNYIHAFEKYLKSYVKGCKTQTCGEASDTAVRNLVRGFVDKAAQSFNVSSSTIDDLWNRHV